MNELDEIAFLVDRKKYDHALKKLREYLSLFPEESRAYYLIGICSFGKKNLSDAKKYLTEAIRLDPQLPAYYNFAASIEKEKKDFSACIKLTDSSLNLEPLQAEPHLIKAQVAILRGDYMHAKFCAETALKIAPESIMAKNCISSCYLEKKKYEDAKKLIFEVLTVAPEDYVAQVNLAEWKWFTGKSREARVHYQELLKADPDNDHTQQALKRVIKYKNPLARLLLQFQIFSIKNQEVIGGVLHFILVLISTFLTVSQVLLDNFDPDYTLGIFLSLFIAIVFPYKILPQLLNIVLWFDDIGKFLLTKREKLMMSMSTIFLFLGIFMLFYFYHTYKLLVFHPFTLCALSCIYISGLLFDLIQFKVKKSIVILGSFYFFFLLLHLTYYFFPDLRGLLCGLIISCLIGYNLLLLYRIQKDQLSFEIT